MQQEQDYLMRQIKEVAQVVCRWLRKRQQLNEEDEKKKAYWWLKEKKHLDDLDLEIEETALDGIAKLAINLADQGRINEAENLLFKQMDSTDMNQFYVVMDFFEHINTYSDEFLTRSHYTRQEIIQGMKDLSKAYGVTEIVTPLLIESR